MFTHQYERIVRGALESFVVIMNVGWRTTEGFEKYNNTSIQVVKRWIVNCRTLCYRLIAYENIHALWRKSNNSETENFSWRKCEKSKKVLWLHINCSDSPLKMMSCQVCRYLYYYCHFKSEDVWSKKHFRSPLLISSILHGFFKYFSRMIKKYERQLVFSISLNLMILSLPQSLCFHQELLKRSWSYRHRSPTCFGNKHGNNGNEKIKFLSGVAEYLNTPKSASNVSYRSHLRSYSTVVRNFFVV